MIRRRINLVVSFWRPRWHHIIPLWALFLLPVSAWSENWIEDELLKQINELRLEVVGLKERVNTLEQGQVKSDVNANLPKKTSFTIDLAGSALGSKNADIAIVEFSDFQCGYCKRFHRSTFKKLEDNYINTGKLRYYQRDFPLDFHDKAFSAAVASRCVGEQAVGGNNLYWPMRHKLFSNGLPFNEKNYRTAAESVGADLKKFDACWRDGRQQAEVMKDIQYGRELSVTGTPQFFVGRIKGETLVDVISVTGSQPYDVFVKHINFLAAK